MSIVHYVPEPRGTESSAAVYRIFTEGDLTVLCSMPQSETRQIQASIRRGIVNFYFSSAFGSTFTFGGGRYRHILPPDSTLLLFYPYTDSTFTVEVPANESLVGVHMSIEALHRLFLPDHHELHFLRPENVERDYFQQRNQTAGISTILYQIMQEDIPHELELVFTISKIYELLYHYFKSDADQLAEKCPFLVEQVNVDRIRLAKQILSNELRSVPNIKDLARRVGMNETHLKSGFKRIYGCPIYAWVIEQRMTQAHHLIVEGVCNVNEVADFIGYVNVSQFIAAFRRRYGITPGKLLHDVKSRQQIEAQL